MNAMSLQNLAISSAKTQRGATSVHVLKDTSCKKMGEAAKVKIKKNINYCRNCVSQAKIIARTFKLCKSISLIHVNISTKDKGSGLHRMELVFQLIPC